MRRLKVSGLDSSSVSLGMRNPQRGALISLSLSLYITCVMRGGDKGKILLSKGLTKILLVIGFEEEDLDEGLIDFGWRHFIFLLAFCSGSLTQRW
jgi:hypothetical protein